MEHISFLKFLKKYYQQKMVCTECKKVLKVAKGKRCCGPNSRCELVWFDDDEVADMDMAKKMYKRIIWQCS